MTFETYLIAGGVIGAIIGLVSGLSVRRRQLRLVMLLLSFAVAFVGISGLVVGHEILYGKDLLAGLVWALLYSPVNLGLAGVAPIFCGLGWLLRSGVGRPPASSVEQTSSEGDIAEERSQD